MQPHPGQNIGKRKMTLQLQAVLGQTNGVMHVQNTVNTMAAMQESTGSDHRNGRESSKKATCSLSNLLRADLTKDCPRVPSEPELKSKYK